MVVVCSSRTLPCIQNIVRRTFVRVEVHMQNLRPLLLRVD